MRRIGGRTLMEWDSAIKRGEFSAPRWGATSGPEAARELVLAAFSGSQPQRVRICNREGCDHGWHILSCDAVKSSPCPCVRTEDR